MEFYKSRNNRDVAECESKALSRSHVSSTNNARQTASEYASSSTSISVFPPATTSTSAKAFVTVSIDELIIPSSSICSDHKTDIRKRKLSSGPADKDSEHCFEAHLAKRLHTDSTFLSSETQPLVSLVYPSPIDDIVHEIDTQSSSDYLSTTTEFEVAFDDIPDSPVCFQVEDNETVSTSLSSLSTHIRSNSITSQTPQHSTRHNKHTHNNINVRTDDCDKEPAPIKTHSNKSMKKGSKSVDSCIPVQYSMTPASGVDITRMCPLPALTWANAQDVWKCMCKKDKEAACFRDSAMFSQHPGLQPRMRAILFDWLIEVCEVYKLHRETYYLAVDYIDRYLSAQKKVQKTHLQLIGITCLFIAAKVEEIYPPKIGEFAYVTDGACQEEDILQHEILILQALNWKISPVTAIAWLGIYMQLNVNNQTPALFNTTASKISQRNKISDSKSQKVTVTKQNCELLSTDESRVDDAFLYPQFSGMEFVQTAQLLDLCSLDVCMGDYPYSIIAAAAISHTFNREIALHCTGLDWHSIQPCALWMEPFFQVVCEESEHLHLMEQEEFFSSKYGMTHVCPNIISDDSHNIQTHTTTMAMFDRACSIQEQQYIQKYLSSKVKQESSPAEGPEGLLTPPASGRKPLNSKDDE